VFRDRKGEEQMVTLNLGGSDLYVTGERNGGVIAQMPYRDISYAVYARAKKPLYSVALASPPGDPEFPGNIFSGDRHWLAIQSRTTYVILRLNDGDWTRVIEAVRSRTGVAITGIR
jgi:hypothetical protein